LYAGHNNAVITDWSSNLLERLDRGGAHVS